MKKWLSVVLVACLCCGLLAGCDSKEKGSGNEEKTEVQAEDMEEDTKKSEAQVEEGDAKKSEGQVEEKEQENELTGNILLDTKPEVVDVLSGTNEFIGSRVLYKISKNDMQSVSQEQFAEFMDKRVLGISKTFNYLTIDFGDGTGFLCMPGIAVATYGEIDETGSIINQIGVVMPEESGLYSYNQTN